MKLIRRFLARRRLNALVKANRIRLAAEQARHPRRRDGRFARKGVAHG